MYSDPWLILIFWIFPQNGYSRVKGLTFLENRMFKSPLLSLDWTIIVLGYVKVRTIGTGSRQGTWIYPSIKDHSL